MMAVRRSRGSSNGVRSAAILAFLVVFGGTLLGWPLLARALGLGFARSFGSGTADQVLAVALDGAGNTYLTGLFSGTVDFDRTASSSGDTLTSRGGFDGFLLKLDPSGAFVWVRGFGGSGHDDGGAIAVDGNGNVYLTGVIANIADFYDGGGTLNAGILDSPVFNDAVILKMSSGGSLVWARGIVQSTSGASGSRVVDRGLGIAVDSGGNVYVSGTFVASGTADLYTGGTVLNSDIFPLSAGTDGYLVKLNTNGAFQWGRGFNGTGDDAAYGVAVSGGNVYVAGSFQATVDFDRTAASSGDTLTAQGDSSIFLVKLNTSGNFLWVRAMGGSTGDNQGAAVAVDSSGVYVVGNFEGTGDFDRTASSAGDTLTSNGLLDVFAAKLDSSGGFLWARGIGGSGFDQALSVATNGLGVVWIAGLVDSSGSIDFDPGSGTFPLATSGDFDAFRLALDANGGFLRAEVFGGSEDDQGFGIAMDGVGNVVVGGAFRSTIDVDSTQSAPGDTLTSQGGDDAFVAKLDAVADVGVNVSDGPDPIVRGSDLTYNITAQNAGPEPATSATLSVPLPVGATFVSVAAPNLWVCTTPAVGTNGTITCSIPTFAPGTAAFTVVMHVDPGVAAPSSLSSLVTLSATTADPSVSNNGVNVSTAVSAPPTVVTTAAPLVYTENQPATAVDPGLNVADPDSVNLASASVQVTAGYQAGQDLLACPACASQGISASFAAAAGRLDLSGAVLAANYQAALRSVTYQNTSENPSTAARTASFQVADSPGNNVSNVATRGIAVVRGPNLTVGDVRIKEGDAGTTTATFTVALAPASADTVTVQVRTQDGPATAGSDYVALPPTTLTFLPGETSKLVTVSIKGDTTVESDETFSVILSDATSARISRATATGHIVNDDSPNPQTLSQVVTAQAIAVPGRLQVTVRADILVCPASNVLQRIDFGASRNARVEVPGAAPGTPGGPSQSPGGPNGTPGNFTLPVNAQSVTFYLQRQAPGDFKVDMAIVDTCNAAGAPFRTFVGGGVGVP